MKILAVSHSCVTDVNQQFYAELEALGHQVKLIVPDNFRSEYAKAPIDVQRWPHFQGEIVRRRIGLPGSIQLHFYISGLRQIMHSYDPDVLFVEEEPYSVSAWQAFYASRGMPLKRIIYSCQNIVKKYPPPFRWMEKYVLKRANAAAVISRLVGLTLKQKDFSGQVIPFPLGVNTNQFRPLPEERAKLRRELKVMDRFVVGFVGRFVEEKGIRNLLKAAAALAEEPFAFVFVGNGELKQDIELARKRGHGKIIIADQVKHKDVHNWMNAMDVLVLPSLTKPNWKEQFGRVVLEAMACRVPVIGSDSGEIPLLLRETGGGWVYREREVSELVAAIRHASSRDAERDWKASIGLAYVTAHYSKKALAKSFERYMMSIVGNKA